ncbi:unnamed protein product [Clonostachys rosea f. rosea IK726]|jgi:hypothetical protein|uniref:Uncharacterized protein n=1 Tax=Clonostachys rosea f. rosea IK726 TaxID=1349383 RepID=A0ACA9TXT5_BIOOC|nr:unnamed protein product [Clonostachys rosea f. rosea IK726]
MVLPAELFGGGGEEITTAEIAKPKINRRHHRGRFIQLKDSAHYFLPDSDNDASQASGDALPLAHWLKTAGNGEELATKVHPRLRFERVSNVQKLGVTN